MDNLDLGKSASQDSDKPIPLDDIGIEQKGVSHSPLDLGGSRPLEVQKVQNSPPPQPVSTGNAPAQTISMGRITGIKTFFTKLHPGALNFLDEQITEWLKKNPDIVIKRTNVTVGEIQAKKTEPNIVITIWY